MTSLQASQTPACGNLDTLLHQAGILEAVSEMGMTPSHFAEDLSASRHNYNRYRWSVARGEDFSRVIHAVPPEEEVGWTPWERWTTGSDGEAIHQCWVAAPDIGVQSWHWRRINYDRQHDLRPLFAVTLGSLGAQLQRARVNDAFELLDIDRSVIEDLRGHVLDCYHDYRWVVIPHFLADDGPVVNAIPPLKQAADWPWETWYKSNGQVIHHVHYAAPRPGCNEPWIEPINAPQRPPEVLARTWYWADVHSMTPIMATESLDGRREL